MEDVIKSIKATLYDRISSPLYGSFIISWLVLNWKIPYVTFFISEDNLKKIITNEPITKIEYITKYCETYSYCYLFWLPLIYAAILILIVPFISTGALWVKLKFDKWNHDFKMDHEKSKSLTGQQAL